jgi:hypothetical protein
VTTPPDDTTEMRNEIAAQLHRDARRLRRRSLGRDQHTSYKLLLQAFTLHTAAAKIASKPEPAADVEIEELRVEVAAAEEGIADLRRYGIPDNATESEEQ